MRKDKSHILQLLRFGIVGFLNTIFAYLVFALFLWLGCHFTLATLIGGVCSVISGFKLHGRFVFDNPKGGRFIRFVIFFCIIYMINVGIQAILRPALDGYIAGAIAIAITVPVSFLLNRNFVFHRKGDKEHSECDKTNLTNESGPN